MSALVRALWLATIWVLLWGDVSAANVISGLAVAVGVMALVGGARASRVIFRPLPAVHFAAYFCFKLAEATAILAREVVTPQNNLRRGIVAVPLSGCSDRLATLIANAISLTPGTLTLELQPDPTTLYVHVLHLHDPDAVRRDIHRLEVLAVRAFGSKAAINAVEVDDSRTVERLS
jgi:multicomponent Na+:H+ antiporter subunit E